MALFSHRMHCKSLSLIFLVYNEQATLAEIIGEAVAFCDERALDWEIIIVDDGSRDDSNAIARGLAGADPRIRVVVHAENRGMGAGMRTGIDSASKEHLVFFPADGQTPVDELCKFFPLLDSADIVVSVYERLRPSLTRQVMSSGMRALMRIVAGIRFRLEGLYVFPTALARELAPRIPVDTFFFSFELIDRAMQRGARVASTTMRYELRRAGSSKVANWPQIKRVTREVFGYSRRKYLTPRSPAGPRSC